MNNLLANAWPVLLPFAPVIIVAVTLLVVMISIALKRSHFLTGTVAVVGLNLGLFTLIGQIMGWFAVPEQMIVSRMFIVDPFAQFNMVFIFLSSLACCTLAYPYFKTFKDHKEELYMLLLLSTIGALLMVAA
ncbi:NADH-quinone oxidoreductase subunit N, partial [Leptospira borgpetersenii serovar Balcanica]|nr:NADH-quinone oxidoreductase subunit N [Leptospira borgpetersenii serovar Balcanica]